MLLLKSASCQLTSPLSTSAQPIEAFRNNTSTMDLRAQTTVKPLVLIFRMYRIWYLLSLNTVSRCGQWFGAAVKRGPGRGPSGARSDTIQNSHRLRSIIEGTHMRIEQVARRDCCWSSKAMKSCESCQPLWCRRGETGNFQSFDAHGPP